MMHYPVVIHKDRRSDFGVTVPDLPGCFSAGKTIDEALGMAREAIELHLQGIVEDGGVIPRPGSIDAYRVRREYADGLWGLVSVDPSELRMRTVRINVTIPQRVLDVVDRYAQEHGETRSGLLARGAVTYMGREANGGLVKQRKRRTRNR